jgi:hypothetical protein
LEGTPLRRVLYKERYLAKISGKTVSAGERNSLLYLQEIHPVGIFRNKPSPTFCHIRLTEKCDTHEECCTASHVLYFDDSCQESDRYEDGC